MVTVTLGRSREMALWLRTINRYYYHPLNKRCCTKCFIIYEGIRENFHIKKYDGGNVIYNTLCKRCFNEINRRRLLEYRRDPAVFIKSKISGFRHRAKEQSVDYNLTVEHLIDLWNAQNGRCFYTGELLDFTLVAPARNRPHLFTPSLDRKTPSDGYITGNVVWCTYMVNRAKNELSYEEFVTLCSTILSHRNER